MPRKRTGSLTWRASGWRAFIRITEYGKTARRFVDLESTNKNIARRKLERLAGKAEPGDLPLEKKIAGSRLPTVMKQISFVLFAALACDNPKPPEETAAEALAREKAATAARRAKLNGTDPESLAKAAKEKAEAPARVEADAYGRASCVDLAQQNRDIDQEVKRGSCDYDRHCERIKDLDKRKPVLRPNSGAVFAERRMAKKKTKKKTKTPRAPAADFTPIRWDRIDPGIRDVVAYLRARGFDTFNSCQGGPGHTYDMPSVSFLPNPGESYEQARERGVRSLLAGGYRDFSTDIAIYHGYTSRPEAGGWPTQIDVKFWVDEIPIRPYARRRAKVTKKGRRRAS